MTSPSSPDFVSRLRALPSWVRVLVAAVLAACVTLAVAATYYTGVVAQWESHADALAAERDTALESVEASEKELEVVTDDRNDYRDSVEASEERAVLAESQLATMEQREADVAAAEAKVGEREAAVTSTEQRIADTTILEGRWTVGVDIEAGSYRVTEPVTGDRCYWAITVTGSNGDDIVSNDYGTQGNHNVTLRDGQDFETSRCGTWSKQ